MMGSTTLFLVVTLAAALSPVLTVEPPCPAEGCGNITVYIGTRWGSRVIHYPRPQVNISGSEETNELPAVDTNHRTTTTTSTARPFPYQRPVPADNRFRVDWSDSLRRNVLPRVFPERGPSTTVKSFTNSEGFINMTGMRLTGEDVKLVLATESTLDVDVMKSLVCLHLSHNNITQLPPLVFPVQLEYGLQELSLDNNPLDFLGVYTRFELSRLGHLRNLSLARTGLSYMNALYLPNLEVLNLNHNYLYSLPDDLSRYPNLRELYLRGNKIHTPGVNSLNSLYHLKVLDLSHNRISNIYFSSYSLSINTLYLNNNSLYSFPNLDSVVPSNLYISDNPFTCSCELIRDARRVWKQIVDRDNLTCTDDSRVLPRMVSGLDMGDMGTCYDRYNYDQRKVSWLEGVRRMGRDFCWWVENLTDWSTLFVGTVWFIIMVLVYRKFNERKTKKSVPSEMPYNMLDDRQIV